MWCNYIINFNNNNINRTYNGMTNNIDKRITQHNNILSGGAKYTTNLIKKYPHTQWNYICIIKGFKSKSEAMKAEWRIKHPTNKKTRPNKFNKDNGRILGLNYIFSNSEKWTSNSEEIKNQNLTIEIKSKYKNLLDLDKLKILNINIIYI